jgi:hypothetical protein
MLTAITASAKISPNKPVTFKAPEFKAEETEAPITTPIGDKHSYYERVEAISPYGGSILVFHEYGIAGEIVFDDATKTAYLKNPVSYLPYNTYIKGSYDDSTITFNFPQPLFDSYGTIYYAYRFDYTEDSTGGWFEADPEQQTVKFNIAADGTVEMENTNDGDFIIGVYDTELKEWRGYGDYNINLTPFNQQALTAADMPEGFAENLQNWQLVADRSSALPKVAEYDGKIYIANLFESNPDAMIVGTIDGDKVTFTSGQFVGIDKTTNYYAYFYGMTTTETTDPDVGTIITFNKSDKIVFTLDREAQTLSSTGSCGFANDKPDSPYVFSTFIKPVITHLGESYSTVPADPTELEFTEYQPGMGVLSFCIDNINADGKVLDENKLFYRIYVDDQLFTFSADEYYVDEDMTDVPFNFTEGWDFLITGNKRGILFYYDESPQKFAVQLVYKDGDTETASNLVTLDLAHLNAATYTKTIDFIEYLDLYGRVVVNPTNGVYIQRTTFTDGATSTTKIALRK